MDLIFQANMFMVNLAISDLGIFCSQGPLMFINAFASDFWMYGTLWCKLYGCTGGIFGSNFFILYPESIYVFAILHSQALVLSSLWFLLHMTDTM